MNHTHNEDIELVFNNAERFVSNVKEEYMYMYTDNRHDFFKHVETRNYTKVPKA